MLLIAAALLAGSLLATIECFFIVWTCGPYWVGPLLFLQTWGFYAAAAFLGLLPFHLLIGKRRTRRPGAEVLLITVAGCIALFTLIRYDLTYGRAYLTLLVVMAGAGLLATAFWWLIMRGRETSAGRVLAVALLLMVTLHLFYFAVDHRAASALEQRNTDYDGTVPHLCLAVIDTLRGDHFSCCGYPHQTTPRMDALAAEGLLCTRSYSAANHTPPGHISIFTGLYPAQHGNDGKPYTPDDLTTLTEVIRKQGFFCAALYNNQLAGKIINLTQGFDIDLGIFKDSWVRPAWHRLIDRFVHQDAGARTTFYISEKLYDWVSSRGGHLFLYLNLMEPHAGYVTHEPWFSEFLGDVSPKDIPNLDELARFCRSVQEVTHDREIFDRFTPDAYEYMRAAYDSEIAYLDHHFGEFTDELARSGLLDQTLLVITADHAEFLGEYLTRGHPKLLFSHVLHIPLIIRYPSLIEPAVIDEVVSNVDIFPTVLTLMGHGEAVSGTVQGIDIFNDPTLRDRYLIGEGPSSDQGCYTLFNGTHKLIHNNPEILEKFPHEYLLFNMADDPRETRNIFAEQQELGQEMVEMLRERIQAIERESAGDIEISDDTNYFLKALGYVE